MLTFDLSKGYPLLTTKKMFTKGIIHELLWMISGNSNIRYLVQNGVNIWNEWPYQQYIRDNKLEIKYPLYSQRWLDEKERFVEKIITNEKFAKKWGDCGPFYGVQWRNFRLINSG
jgi:thymidylate synthase